MKEFFATIEVANDEERRDFCKDVSRHNMHVRVETADGEHFYHYAILGNWSGYKCLLEIINKQNNTKSEGKYQIHSLEHFED